MEASSFFLVAASFDLEELSFFFEASSFFLGVVSFFTEADSLLSLLDVLSLLGVSFLGAESCFLDDFSSFLEVLLSFFDFSFFFD